MKFSNGCWLEKEGTAVFSPAEVYYVKKESAKLTITAPTSKINHRGDTLGGVNLTISITSPGEDVIRIRADHYLGVVNRGPEFELQNITNKDLDITENDDEIIVLSGKLKLVITKCNCYFKFYRIVTSDNGESEDLLTTSSWKDLAYVKTDWKGLAYDDGGLHNTYMRQQLLIDVNEHIYGLGERFTPFIKNGQVVDIWNEDGGTSTHQSYKNIPFYISDKGYGVFVNHPEKVSMEVGSENVTKVGFSVPGERLDYFIIAGTKNNAENAGVNYMKDVLVKYTDLTGKPSLPAPWTFGLWLSTSFTTNYDEKTVNEFVDGMLDRDIPLKVFHFDCFWMKEFAWSDFTWDSRVFPDPVSMIKGLKEKGLKICVWINSYIGQESILFEEGVKNGYFIKRPNGNVYQWDMWQPGMAIVDFTNPAAREWYASKLESILDMGVDALKTDFGERIPTDVVYYDGSDPQKMHNYYTYLYNKTVFDLLKRKKGEKEAILFARSATAGSQKFPVHWGGDCWSDYVSMEESLRGGLSLTMSGFGFWSHDIGGFEDKSTPDVYKRWCAFGLLSTHSRLHGSGSYRVPWNYDDEAVDVVRRFTKLKAELMPYLYRNAVETSVTGIPMLRSMVLEYTEDPTCAYLDKQYMLGDSLLVAPIFNDKGMAQYYLPEGEWVNYITGEIRNGGKWYKEYHDYFSIPLYVKPGSIVAVGNCNSNVEYDYTDNVTFKICSLEDGRESKVDVYEMYGESPVMSILVRRKGNEYDISVTRFESSAIKPYNIEIISTDGVKKVENIMDNHLVISL